MKRIYKILATGFLALVLFLNIGLTLSMNLGLHAHFLGNNQILIHLHNSPSGDHSHNNSDCGGSSNFVFSTTLTYLNDNVSIAFNSQCKTLNLSIKVDAQNGYFSFSYNNSQWRGPPIA